MCDVERPQRRRSFSRPRSPIPRIKQLFSLKNPSPSRPPPESLGYTIPVEIITKVGDHITTLSDILSISLTCRRARSALLPRLYDKVELRTNRHCKAALELFAKSPEYTQLIRSLTVRPNNVERTPPAGNCLDETLIAKLLIKIATRMPLLQSFSWGGLEMPDDRVWQALRQFCPLLKSISTNVGFLPIKSSDLLFDFRDLTSFSLIVKSDSLEWLSDGPPHVEKLPRRFWQMLIEYCPKLKELTIGGPSPSPRLFDTRHITAGRWPQLQRITLGDMRLQSPPDQDEMTPENHALSKFLIAHPKLTHVAFLHPGAGGLPSSLLLPPFTLPNMHTFCGPLRYIRCLPNPVQLQNLSITTLHHCLSSFPPTYGMLKTLPSLVSLALWIDLSFANRSVVQDDGTIFRTLLECCPRLVHLDLYCFTRPTFHVKEFSTALRRSSPCLRSFSLTKIYKTSDEDMIHSAVRILHDNPNIQNFTLRYAQDSWLTHSTGSLKQVGEYEVLQHVDGSPSTLRVCEWGFRSFGNTFSHHYIHNLKSPKVSRRGSGSSRLSFSSIEPPHLSLRPQSVLSFNSFQHVVK